MGQQLIPGWTNGPYVESGTLVMPRARIVKVVNEDGSEYDMPTSPGSGGCLVPEHESQYNHELLHGNSQDHAHSNIAALNAVSGINTGDQNLGDITKEQIEAKLIGEISSHSHAGGGSGVYAVFIMDL